MGRVPAKNARLIAVRLLSTTALGLLMPGRSVAQDQIHNGLMHTFLIPLGALLEQTVEGGRQLQLHMYDWMMRTIHSVPFVREACMHAIWGEYSPDGGGNVRGRKVPRLLLTPRMHS